MRNLQDTFYPCKRVSTRFKTPRSPVFLNNYEQNKTKNFQHTFVDIEKSQRKETVLEFVLIEVFISLNKRPDFWKSI